MSGNFWTPKNEKLIVTAGIGVVGYSVVSQAFAALPSLPAFVLKPIFGQISLLTIAGGLSLYGILMLYTKY